MTRRYLTVALLVGVVVCTAAFAFGGWAVVTVEDVPEHLVAGESVPLSFVVRQHGETRLSGLSPSVTLRSGGTSESVAARLVLRGRGNHAIASQVGEELPHRFAAEFARMTHSVKAHVLAHPPGIRLRGSRTVPHRAVQLRKPA